MHHRIPGEGGWRFHQQVARNCERDPSNKTGYSSCCYKITRVKKKANVVRNVYYYTRTLAKYLDLHLIQPAGCVQTAFLLPAISAPGSCVCVEKKSISSRVYGCVYHIEKSITSCLQMGGGKKRATTCLCITFFVPSTAIATDGNEMTETLAGSFFGLFFLPLRFCQRQTLDGIKRWESARRVKEMNRSNTHATFNHFPCCT